MAVFGLLPACVQWCLLSWRYLRSFLPERQSERSVISFGVLTTSGGKHFNILVKQMYGNCHYRCGSNAAPIINLNGIGFSISHVLHCIGKSLKPSLLRPGRVGSFPTIPLPTILSSISITNCYIVPLVFNFRTGHPNHGCFQANSNFYCLLLKLLLCATKPKHLHIR